MKFRKILLAIILCSFFLISNNCIFANVEDVEDYLNPMSSSTIKYGDYEYLIAGDGIYIIGYSGSVEELVIPETLNGQNVIGLYSECFSLAPNLRKIVIPSTVDVVYVDTFLNCRTLENIEVDSNNITYASYNGCLYSKDYNFFVTCPEGRKGAISIRNGTLYICDNSFLNASKVTSITIPSTVYDIGELAFYGTTSLTSFSISNTNKYFTYSDGLLYNKDKTELIKCIDTRTNCVNIASSVKSIRDYAFYNCSNLVGPINFPDGLSSIGKAAFLNCSSLTGEINMPSSLTIIGEEAFYGCSSIDSLNISPNIDKIPDDCFGYCKGLKEIVIPNQVKEIGERAFFDCSNVEKLTLGSGLNIINNWAFDYLTSLKGDLIIPNSVTKIGDAAFGESPSLDGYIVIGASVNQIGNSAFYRSANAKGVIFKGSVPAIQDYAFTKPDIPYYYLEGKIGFEEILSGKECYVYTENPIVKYHVNGTIYKEVVQSKYGLTLNENVIPNFEGYTFGGWYYDEEYTKEYKSSDVIMNNVSLYAKMTTNNKIEFLENKLLLEVGQTYKLEYNYTLEEGATVEDIIWETSDSNIATVDASGNITTISKGDVIITAKYKDAIATANLTVYKEENQIEFVEESIRIVIGEEKDIEINYHLLNNATFEEILWSSSDNNIVTVENGKIVACNEGNAIITANYEDAMDTVEIVVVRPNKLDITTEDLLMKVEKNNVIDIDFYFNDGANKSNIIWSSSNEKIATVENGLVKGVSEGEVTITAKYDNVLDSIKVTVVNKDSISFDSSTVNVENTNATYNLKYNFYSYDHTEDEILWGSSNEEVATVEKGILTINKNGKTVISASLGEATSYVIINVVDPNRLDILEDTIKIEYRKDATINLNIDYYFNDNGTANDIVYKSNNTDVIQVVENKLEIVGVGKATVTATYKNVSDTALIEIVSIDKLEFNKMGYIMKIGNRKNIDYSFDSYLGDIQNVIFTSSNSEIVRVEGKELVAVGLGEVTINAKYGDMEDEITVVVASKDYLLGDVDINGVINANDAALVLDMYKNGNVTSEQLLIADVNFDKVANANDAALILDMYKNGQ